MATNYEEIGEENRRKYGTETAHLEILHRLYAQRTHFLYELLQNAEDACASRVAIGLHADRFEFWHDGRVFDELDLRGVCGVCTGTKTNDLEQIGKFGIGFKSVYSYTKNPEIHSGEEHFRIEGYTQPRHVSPRMDLGRPWTTLQVFPFDSEKVKPERARKEIDQALKKLGMRTLIFLKNIHEVHWEIAGDGSGTLRRSSKSRPSGTSRQVEVGEDQGDHIDAEEWLIFRRPITVPREFAGDPGTKQTVDVEVGYRLAQGAGTERSICRAQGTELVVFFPTQRETHLGFLIQGPYRTTPARDNIREDDEWNDLLIAETALLIGDTLKELKRRKLLTVDVLDAMPICAEDFPEDGVFRPIFDHVRETLLEQALLPSAKGKYTAGEHVKLCATPDIRKLLTPNILRQLFRTVAPLNWVEGELSEDLHEYLVAELGIEEVTPETLAHRLDEAFMERRTDAWVARFYAFLDGRRKLWEKGKIFTPPLRSKPFIRLRDKSHVPPFDADGYPQAWLPGPFHVDEFPIVRPEVIQGGKRALNFLNNLGLSEPDCVDEVLSRVLPRYQKSGSRITPKQHARDLELINLALKTDSDTKRRRLMESLRQTPFLRAVNSVTGRRRFRCPGEVYERRPELEHYFEGNCEAWFLDDDLPGEPNIFFAEAVLDEVSIVCEEARYSGYVPLPDDEAGLHRRGVAGFDQDCYVEGLEVALERITLRKAAFIWNKLLLPLADQIRGEVDYSTSVYFQGATREAVLSRMGQLVTEMAWLPSRSLNGSFQRPGTLSLENLPDGFEPDRSLATALGMRASGVERFAEENAIDVESLGLFLKEFRENPAQVQKLLKKLQRGTQADGDANDGYSTKLIKTFGKPGTNNEPRYIPPPGPVKNTEKLLVGLAEDLQARKTEVTVRRSSSGWGTRRVAPSKDPDTRAFLKAEYDGCCQICGQTFLKRNGEPYFDGVYLVSLRHGGWVDHPGNVLCLCATCSAKFRYGSIEAADILGQIQALRLSGEGGVGELVIEILLCHEPVKIRFTERHAARLRVTIGAETSR